MFLCVNSTEFYNSHFNFYYFLQVTMLRFICLPRKLLEVVDFVTAQEEELLGYNMKVYQHNDQ